MTKTSPTQIKILKAASKKPDEDIRQHMDELKSPAIRDKVVQSMLKSGFIQEAADKDGGLIYTISAVGMHTFGGRRGRDQRPDIEKRSLERAAKRVEKPQPDAKAPTKQQILIDLLKRKQGATLKQMMEATGWQKHSLHGAMAGNFRKKLGLVIVSTKDSGGERVYKIA